MVSLVVAAWASLTVFVIWMAVASRWLRRQREAWQRRLYEEATKGSTMTDRELLGPDVADYEWVPPPS